MAVQDLIEVNAAGEMIFHFHPGQLKAWDSRATVTAIIAGTQSGKTSFGPLWLFREMKIQGPGDYIVATPTFPLLEVKALPEFRALFEDLLRLGKYQGSPVRKFVLSSQGEISLFGGPQKVPTTVYFGYAANPDSLESMTAKAAWLDEAGQNDFKVGSYEAIQRRLSLARALPGSGRMLLTTTPYNLGWLKTRVWNKRRDPDYSIKVVRFDSTQNPRFPKSVMEQAKRELPRWKFNMFYRGIFSRPAGLIYDNFDDSLHTCPRFPIPDRWKRYIGLDFGGVNTAAIFLAEDPGTKKLYAYREYLAGGRTASGHKAVLLEGEPGTPEASYGGAKSEEQWRQEFRAAGLPIKQPVVSDVEVGIDRVYGALARLEVVYFDDLEQTIDEYNTYSRELDAYGEPTEKIDDKNKFHLLDANRYILGSIRGLQDSTSTIFNPPAYEDDDPNDDLAWGQTYRR